MKRLAMRVGVLGPLQVRHEVHRCLSVPPSIEFCWRRCSCAPTGWCRFNELAETLWEGSATSDARVTVRTYVFRLRHVLGREDWPQARQLLAGALTLWRGRAHGRAVNGSRTSLL